MLLLASVQLVSSSAACRGRGGGMSRVAGGICPIGVKIRCVQGGRYVACCWWRVSNWCQVWSASLGSLCVCVLVCVEPCALCAAWLQDFYAVVNRAELERCEREGVEPDRARMRRNLTVGADNLLGLFA